MESLIGTALGAYQIVSELGRGGMAAVYKAHQPSLNRYVALKVPLPHVAGDATFVARFLREARIAAGLQNPHIIRIYDVSDSPPYHIAMEFIEGETLTEMLRHGGVLDLSRMVSILFQVADALDYAHARRVIHRDVKPSNILIDQAGNVYLTDFGIARATEGTRLTETGVAMGTPEYMSPEQCQGMPVDAQTDIYALGIIAYEMLTGRVPFHGDTPLVTLHQQVYDPPLSPRRFNPRLSPEVERVVLKALAKQPAGRYASALEFARDFAAPAGAMESPTIPSPVVPSRKNAATLAMAIGCIVLAVSMLIGLAMLVVLARSNPNVVPPLTSIASDTGAQTLSSQSITPQLVPATSLLPLPKGTSTPMRTETLTPTRSRTPTPTKTLAIFREDFEGLSPDSSRWGIANTGNTILVNGRILYLASASTNYPFIYSRRNPFPPSGDYRMSYRFRYARVDVCGVGILMTSYALTAGLTQDQAASYQRRSEDNGMAAGVWQDIKEGLHVLFRSGADRVDVPYPGTDTEWHKMVIEYSQSQYEIYLDNRLSYTSQPTPHRGQFIWMGNPVELGAGKACPWDTLEVDYVQVESLP